MAIAVPDATGVVGGTSVQIASAPWVVVLRQASRSGTLVCTGAVLDSLHVLTAGHCVFDLSGAVAVPAALTVRAGVSNYSTAAPTDAQQERGVSSFRVHPGYTWSTGVSADDVAVLALSAPLDLSTPQVQAAPLPTGSGDYPKDASVTVAGFGRESGSTAPDGSLNEFTATVDPQGECGGFPNRIIPSSDAIALCAATPSASLCSGDSGAALVTADATHTIVGIASAGPTSCNPGGHGVFTNVEAPEILDFIHGNDHPAIAPRMTEATYVTLDADRPLYPGARVKCTSVNWNGGPTLTYAFVDRRTGAVIQQDASGSLLLTARMVGTALACRAIATNAGGTATLETLTTDTVESPPKLGIEHVPALTARRARPARMRVWLRPGGAISGKYGVCIIPPRRVGSRACASGRATGDVGRIALTVTMRIAPAAPLGAAKVALRATAGPSVARATALLHVVR